MPIKDWSTTAGSNATVGSINWAEGQAPSTVNNSARQLMADVATWYQDAEWINLSYTHTFASSTSFTISGVNVTSTYSIGRRVRVVGTSTGTIYGAITNSAFATNTTVTIAFDSGSMSNEALTVSLALIKGGSSARSLQASGIRNAFDTSTSNTLTTQLRMNGAIFLSGDGGSRTAGTTIDLSSATGNCILVTGSSTTVTSLGTVTAGTEICLRFAGAVTLQHNATSLICITSANITTAADDETLLRSLGSGNWKMVYYARKAGTSLSSTNSLSTLTDVTITTPTANDKLHYNGSAWVNSKKTVLLQRVYVSTGAFANNGGATIAHDDTIPQISEGGQALSQSFTPVSASSKITIKCVAHINGGGNNGIAFLCSSASTDALAVSATWWGGADRFECLHIDYQTDSGSTSARTYSLRYGSDGGTTYLNGIASARRYGGVMNTSMLIEEWLPGD